MAYIGIGKSLSEVAEMLGLRKVRADKMGYTLPSDMDYAKAISEVDRALREINLKFNTPSIPREDTKQ